MLRARMVLRQMRRKREWMGKALVGVIYSVIVA